MVSSTADDALHTICAKVGLSDAMLLADRRFADILKEYKESNLLRPRVGFDVINILDDKDIVRLKEILEH